MNTNVIGFDPSLTSSGFSYIDNSGQVHTGRIRPKTRGVERLDFVSECFNDLFSSMVRQYRSCPLLVYEGYSMGSPKMGNIGRFFDIGEQGGILKLLAYRRGANILLVPPTSLKKFATGKGNADKESVIASVASVWNYHIPHNDEADAFVLMQMGLAHLNSKKARKKHRIEALKGCSMVYCK